MALGAGLSLLLAGVLAGKDPHSDPVQQNVLHAAPGVKTTPEGKQVRWRKRDTTVYIDASVDRLGPKAHDAIRSAFGTWLESEAQLPRLTFDTAKGLSAEAKPDGKNSVVFAPIRLKGHERDLAITLTYSDERTGDILESDIVINENYPFELLERDEDRIEPPESRPDDDDHDDDHDDDDDDDDRVSHEDADNVRVSTAVQTERRSSCVAQQVESSCGRDVYDVENVLTHEVGHFFGLGEDVDDTASTMYVCTNRCETHKRRLTATDVSVLTALYPTGGSELEESTAAGCGARMVAKGTPQGLVLSALLAALWFTRRRR